MRLTNKRNGGAFEESSIENYLSYINTMPDFIESVTGKKVDNIFSVKNVGDAEHFLKNEFEPIEGLLKKHETNNKVGNFKSAFKVYKEFLSEKKSHRPETIEEFFENPKHSDFDKLALIKLRVGHSKYRSRLIDIWNGCSVTGYNSDYSLLIASHIKPWCRCDKEERTNPYNGFLLLPNLDKLFDNGFISFDEKGKIMVANALKIPEAFGIHEDMMIKLKQGNKPFMEFHRASVFRQ